jgi:hypothetical protein
MEPSGRTTRRPRSSTASERHDRKVNPNGWTTTDQGAGLFVFGLIYSLVLTRLAFGLAGAGDSHTWLPSGPGKEGPGCR